MLSQCSSGTVNVFSRLREKLSGTDRRTTTRARRASSCAASASSRAASSRVATRGTRDARVRASRALRRAESMARVVRFVVAAMLVGALFGREAAC